MNKLNLDPAEIAKFSSIADEWWDETGKFKPLHQINPVRLQYIQNQLAGHLTLYDHPTKIFTELKILDIGCGGGLLAEPLARLGAKVTAIDGAERNIIIAQLHAQQQNLLIDYRHNTIEELSLDQQDFDLVLACEIIEHVPDPEEFIKACWQRVKPGGMIIFTTINRTVKSLLTAKFAAEYILRWLPIGTHDWDKFVTPAEISQAITTMNGQICDISGMSFELWRRKWYLSKDLAVNYLLSAKKV